MFSDFIICIFSYNRAELLQNLLRSISTFYPDMNIAVFDDDSSDKQTLYLLDELENNGIYVHRTHKSALSSKHGGLYYNMNIALRHAMERGYKYAYFVQDDMQFLWRDEDLPRRIQNIFERDECLMCNFNFLQKILKKGIEERLPKVDSNLFSFEGNGVADTGIIELAKAKTASLHFSKNSERDNGRYWYEKGYRLYWSPSSHLAWIPWPASYRFKKAQHRTHHEIKALSLDSIRRLRENRSYTYLEDYTSMKSSFYPKPYWYTVSPGIINLLKIYLKYYVGHIFNFQF